MYREADKSHLFHHRWKGSLYLIIERFSCIHLPSLVHSDIFILGNLKSLPQMIAVWAFPVRRSQLTVGSHLSIKTPSQTAIFSLSFNQSSAAPFCKHLHIFDFLKSIPVSRIPLTEYAIVWSKGCIGSKKRGNLFLNHPFGNC